MKTKFVWLLVLVILVVSGFLGCQLLDVTIPMDSETENVDIEKTLEPAKEEVVEEDTESVQDGEKITDKDSAVVKNKAGAVITIDENGRKLLDGVIDVTDLEEWRYQSFSIKDGSVYCWGSRIGESDPESFEILNGLFEKDKYSVYWNCEKIEGVNSSDSTFLGWDYFKTNEHIYFEDEIVDGADLETFEELRQAYGKDKNYVYSFGLILEGADPETFEVLGYPLARDKNNVYSTGELEPPICSKMDPASIEILEYEYYKDKNTAFWYGCSGVIEGSDPDTFEPLSSTYSKDKNNVYTRGRIISEADVASFQLHPDYPTYAFDKNSIFWEEKA